MLGTQTRVCTLVSPIRCCFTAAYAGAIADSLQACKTQPSAQFSIITLLDCCRTAHRNITFVTASAACRNCSLICKPRCSIVLRSWRLAAGVLSVYTPERVLRALMVSGDSVLISRICTSANNCAEQAAAADARLCRVHCWLQYQPSMH